MDKQWGYDRQWSMTDNGYNRQWGMDKQWGYDRLVNDKQRGWQQWELVDNWEWQILDDDCD